MQDFNRRQFSRLVASVTIACPMAMVTLFPTPLSENNRPLPMLSHQEGRAPTNFADTKAYEAILRHIRQSEGTDGQAYDCYNVSLGYGRFLPGGKEQHLIEMTLDQIDALQTSMLRHPDNSFNSSALGAYQIVRKTLRGLRKDLSLHGNELFDSAMQDKLAIELMHRRGANSTLGQEWASLRGRKLSRAIELAKNIPR